MKYHQEEQEDLAAKQMRLFRSEQRDVNLKVQFKCPQYMCDANHPIVLGMVNCSYTLSHLKNDRDVSVYSGGRRLSSRAQLVCFLQR